MASKQSSSSTMQSCFPYAQSQILPNPSKFFTPDLHALPYPTHSFFQNFVVGNGDEPVFMHPYFVQLKSPGLSLCYPTVNTSSSSVSQDFTPDITISSPQMSRHLVSSFSDLTVTVDFNASDIRLFLARGCPYITLKVSRPLCLTFSCKSAVKSVASCSSNTKQKIELENKQCWIIYSSSDLTLKNNDNNKLVSGSFVGIIRVAIMPNNKAKSEEILDMYKSCYAVSGDAVFSNPFSLDYKWETKGWGELIMLGHPLHLKLITSLYSSEIKVLNNFKYKCVDGDLIGIVGNLWTLRAPYVPITWHSLRGIPECFRAEIVTSLWRDVGTLDSTAISTSHVLYYGYKVFMAARLAMIAEEMKCSDVTPAIRKFLRDAISPWLNNKFAGNGFVYETNWGGIISKQGITNHNADYGFGLFDKFHYLGYFVYAIAVLAKLDPDWGNKFKDQAYALAGTYMNSGRTKKSNYPRLRHFDFYKLHSWKGSAIGGCNSHHSSEHISTYYSAALLGMAFGDDHLIGIASTIASFEIEATKIWFHVKEGGAYGEKYAKENKLVGISTITKRENKLFFAPAEHKETRAGMHILPLLPITETLFSDVGFASEVVEWAVPVVEWAVPALVRKDATEAWSGFVHALEAIYDNESAVKKIKSLKGYNEAHCLTSFLWWVRSRGELEDFCSWCGKQTDVCWFCTYCG